MTKWRDNNASDLKIEFEEGALDSRGILKDGKRARVRMQARDSTSCALLRQRHATGRQPMPDMPSGRSSSGAAENDDAQRRRPKRRIWYRCPRFTY
jgi:hypothetical protein